MTKINNSSIVPLVKFLTLVLVFTLSGCNYTKKEKHKLSRVMVIDTKCIEHEAIYGEIFTPASFIPFGIDGGFVILPEKKEIGLIKIICKKSKQDTSYIMK